MHARLAAGIGAALRANHAADSPTARPRCLRLNKRLLSLALTKIETTLSERPIFAGLQTFCLELSGEVTERPIVRHWKCRVGVKPHRGFESPPLRLNFSTDPLPADGSGLFA